ncbi:MAG: hypothetical protein QXX56_05390 [Candidatus Bathyarchaeia archaeon]
MGFIGDIVGGKIREEIRKRVDEILSAGERWCKSANDLTEAINKLVNLAETGKINPKDLKLISRTAKTLARETRNLNKSFSNLSETIRGALKT